MRFESAELCKIAINCCLVSSISVANTLAELCEGIGANWAEIVPALKLDRRIGAYAYLAPGLGIAGGNLERDLATVVSLADGIGSDAGVVKAWIANSRHRKRWAVDTIRKVVLAANPDALIAVWGLAYKENTASTKNSPSLATIAALSEARLVLHDPVVNAAVAQHPRATAATDAAFGA
jgi:UDPglucose 6-dehydrogenase